MLGERGGTVNKHMSTRSGAGTPNESTVHYEYLPLRCFRFQSCCRVPDSKYSKAYVHDVTTSKVLVRAAAFPAASTSSVQSHETIIYTCFFCSTASSQKAAIQTLYSQMKKLLKIT